MKPYCGRRLSTEERTFNYRHSSARRVVENAFGIMAQRFRVLLSTMQHDVPNVRLIVTVCVLLHNLLRTRYPTFHRVFEDPPAEGVEPGSWRQGLRLLDTKVVTGSNTSHKDGKKLRNLLKHYFCDPVGQVPWQHLALAK